MMKTHLLVTLVLISGTAAAEPVVIAVDGKDVYVDLGARDGVGAGTELELLHEVVVRDPRTGATLRDHFSLGTLSVVKSGDRLSVARANEGIAKRVLAGDRVRLVSRKRKFVDPWAERVAASKPAAAPGPATPGTAGTPGAPARPIDHAELARRALEDTLGQPLENRVARWLDLLRADPRSPYVPAVQREIATLREQMVARDAALASQRSAHSEDRAPRIAALAAQLPRTEPGNVPLIAAPLVRAEPGRRIDLSFAVRDPSRVARAWLYVRPSGDPGFKRIDLVPDGDAYLRASIDASLVRGPTLQWYVEVAGSADADPEPALGSQRAPRQITIERSVVEAPIAAGRSHVDAHVDYVDFDGKLGTGFDQYYQAEIDFTYRFIEPVYAVRLGFGTLAGIGGPKDVIDEDRDRGNNRCLDDEGVYRCRGLSFSYVYTELEFRIRPNVAIMVRPQAGLLTTDSVETMDTSSDRCKTDDVTGCKFFTGFGGRLRLRLGDEAGTNLVLGAGFTDGLGTLLEASYQWRPVRAFPVQLSVQVTDQPVVEDLGVRLIGDVGWRELSWFYPSLRVSYQARDIDHSGVSGGLAMNFDW